MRGLVTLTLVATWLATAFAVPVDVTYTARRLSRREEASTQTNTDVGNAIELPSTSYAALERRTDGAPRRKLGLQEWQAKRQRVLGAFTRAMNADPVFGRNVKRTLGLRVSSSHQGLPGGVTWLIAPEQESQALTGDFSTTEMNNAMIRAGWTGELFPEADEMEVQGSPSPSPTDVAMQAVANFLKDEAAKLRFARALGIDVSDPSRSKSIDGDSRGGYGVDSAGQPNGDWSKGNHDPRAWNAALRAAGYTGPLIPVADGPPDSGPGPAGGSGSRGPSGGGGRGGSGGSGFGRPRNSRPSTRSPGGDQPLFSQMIPMMMESLNKAYGGKTTDSPSTRFPSQVAPPATPFKTPFGSRKPIK